MFDEVRYANGNGVTPELLKAKICLVGEAAVGKSSLVRRFVVDQFDDRYFATLGAKVLKKDVPVRIEGRDVRVALTIWDIMGEPSFRELLKDAFFHGSQGVVGVADLTRPPTARALPAWIDAARSVSGPVPLVLLGNKGDLVPAAGAEEILHTLAGSAGAPAMRTSAKTGMNVEAAFTRLAGLLAKRAIAEGGRRGPGFADDLAIKGVS